MFGFRFRLSTALSIPLAAGASLAAYVYTLYRKDTAPQTQTARPFSAYDAVLPKDKKRLSFVLFYWGSRGDLQPLAVLGRHLKNEGHSILINVRERYRDACLQLGLEESDLYLQEDDRPEDTLARELQGLKGPKMLHALFRHIAGRNEAYVQQLNEMVARSGADVLIVNEFAQSPGQIIAEAHRLPLFIFRYTPILTPTTQYLNPLFGEGNHGKFLNWLSYLPPHLIKAYAERRNLRRLRKQHGLPRRVSLHHTLGTYARQFPSILGYSGHLMPLPEDAPPWYVYTGPMLPPAQEATEEVPENLITFLKENPEGQPIIYIGFGSFSLTQFLPRHRAEEAARAMLRVLDELGVRAVLLEHTFDFMIEDPIFSNPNWYIGKHFPHSWLFPKMSVIVHQGGAGHCAASARSGTPTVVVPIFEEQDMNGDTLVSAGVAVILRIQDLVDDDASFKAALFSALQCTERARALGGEIEREVQSSGKAAVEAIMQWLA